MKTIQFTLFAHWASYLINGDASGLSDQEQAEVDAFAAGKGWCVGVSDDSWFARSNDASRLGGDVAIFTFHNQ